MAAAGSSGCIDGVPPTYIESTFPKLWALHKTVDAHPKVREWKLMHPHHYAKTVVG